MAKKPLFVQWCAKDALDGMQLLSPMEELAYRRVIDLIYASDNNLPDDDEKLGWMTKVGKAKWVKIKAALVGGDDPKLFVRDGKIMCEKCSQELARAKAFSSAQSARAQASAKPDKSLENNNTTLAAAGAGAKPGQSRGTSPAQAGNVPTVNRKPSKITPLSPQTDDAKFEEFCRAYPKRRGGNPRQPARAAWDRAMRDGCDPNAIIAVTPTACPPDRVGTEFVPMMATFLNQRRWVSADPPPPKVATRAEECEIFYAQYLRTGFWSNAFGSMDDVTPDIRERCERVFDRERVEAAGQQRLAV